MRRTGTFCHNNGECNMFDISHLHKRNHYILLETPLNGAPANNVWIFLAIIEIFPSFIGIDQRNLLGEFVGICLKGSIAFSFKYLSRQYLLFVQYVEVLLTLHVSEWGQARLLWTVLKVNGAANYKLCKSYWGRSLHP